MTAFHDDSIAGPGMFLDATERETECRAAMKQSFEALALAAQRVGWDADETALALLRLAGAHVNERVTSSIALAAVRSKQRPVAIERRGPSGLD
jgi:hypothetical protein